MAQIGLLLLSILVLLSTSIQAVPDFQDAAADDGVILFNDSLTNQDQDGGAQHNFTDFVRIRDVMNVFGVDHIAGVWPQLQRRLNRNCSQDLMEYLEGLEEGKMWAMQSRFCDVIIHYIVLFFFLNMC